MSGGDGRARRKILLLEPYYGGSHRAFVDALVSRSCHEYTLLTLPARKWKWRMRGAALWFAQRLADSAACDVDLILTCDMLSVADLRALLPNGLGTRPIVCYFHENQLTYPLSDDDRRDYQFGFTNMTSCLASDQVWFNSKSHMEGFLSAAEELLHKMPDHVPAGLVESIRARSVVRWPLMEPPPSGVSGAGTRREGVRTILWNHRWEYDKGPETLFEALFRLMNEGIRFELILLGESFRTAPGVFADACKRLGGRIVHRGFVRDRAEYWRLLGRADVVVSTADQENFGLAVVEAILCGCYPLLPNRLSYPELIPASRHGRHLYDSTDEFHARLRELVIGPTVQPTRELIDHLLAGCCSDRSIRLYDNGLRSVSRRPMNVSDQREMRPSS